MRYIPNTLAAAATASALLLIGTATAGIAQAQTVTSAPAPAAQPARTQSLYAPSDLVLTIAKGEDVPTATVERAVTLTCAPRAKGTHPTPVSACTELKAVGGDFAALTRSPSHKACTRQWNPVVISAQGVWQGKYVTWSATYGNMCEMEASMGQGTVFSF